MSQVRIPKAFYDHRWSRMVACPSVLREGTRTYTINAADPHLQTLYADAVEFLEMGHGHDLGHDRWLVMAAKHLVAALRSSPSFHLQ